MSLLGSAALAACGGGGGSSDSVAVGSKNFTEQLVLGEMYAQLLEHAGLHVTRKLDLGGTQVAMEALLRGDIDLYPEYTGTALITILELPPSHDAAANYRTVAAAYHARYDLTWLAAAPMNDTQALATTRAIAQRYHLRTLSDLAAAAPQLRLGAIPEFTKREDGLPGLQRAYGGFHFKDVKLFDIGLKYAALLSGDVDVVVAFGTDGQIASDKLVVFIDDKHFWAAYQVAPVVRAKTLFAHPAIAGSLNKLAPLLTDDVMRALNAHVDGQLQEPADVARSFLNSHGLA
ncbi:MAG: glycine betaine ABC transporter substrate-binding protein [Vulcanimicrobiaceae bacterium]